MIITHATHKLMWKDNVRIMPLHSTKFKPGDPIQIEQRKDKRGWKKYNPYDGNGHIKAKVVFRYYTINGRYHNYATRVELPSGKQVTIL